MKKKGSTRMYQSGWEQVFSKGDKEFQVSIQLRSRDTLSWVNSYMGNSRCENI